MNQQTTVTGVILAGGQAKRMNNQDKGLLLYQDKPMISYAIAALSGVVEHIIINANRNHDRYQQFGFPVIADQTDSFDGPLAGLLTAMLNTNAEIILAIPCDSPFIKPEHLQKLLSTRAEQNVDIAVAYDGEMIHPVFLAIKTSLKDSLKNYLNSGQRKMAVWLMQQNLAKVDFNAERKLFVNINNPAELSALNHN